jgi:hypothetical protein
LELAVVFEAGDNEDAILPAIAEFVFTATLLARRFGRYLFVVVRGRARVVKLGGHRVV